MTTEMGEHHEFVNRVKKIASMMETPYEHEVITAAQLLKSLLDEHNMTMLDLRLKNLSPDHAYTDVINEDITEVIFKHSSYWLEDWLKNMVYEVSKVYGVKIVRDRYTNYFKLIGFPYDLVVVEFVIIYLRKYIETQISKEGYTNEKYITGYVSGLIDRIVRSIKEDADLRAISKSRALDESKSFRLATYVTKKYAASGIFN
ncbi:MAG: hypothetical protein ACLQDF_08620 [Desulfomonilia bacterium]